VVTLLGEKLFPVLIRNDYKFTQQLDPLTGEPSGQKPDGYSPMMLAALEYLSRMHGIHLNLAKAELWWSVADTDEDDFVYEQEWGERSFRLIYKEGVMEAFVSFCLQWGNAGYYGPRRQRPSTRRDFALNSSHCIP